MMVGSCFVTYPPRTSQLCVFYQVVVGFILSPLVGFPSLSHAGAYHIVTAEASSPREFGELLGTCMCSVGFHKCLSRGLA